MSASPPRTYSHLVGLGRDPSDYEIATSGLLYYVERGFEVDFPLGDWYRRHQTGSALASSCWDDFRDPRETTYTSYTAAQREKEVVVDAALQAIEDTRYDEALSPSWAEALDLVIAPTRFLFHGLQMTSAYVGQMAPAGRITITAALQAADEMRRVHRVAYRVAQLRRAWPSFSDGRASWQRHTSWQPVRRLVEELLVTYDWGEAFTALNLCAKPVLDELLMVELGATALARGDHRLREILASLDLDCRWHREWSAALVAHALATGPDNRAALRAWVSRWLPRAEGALEALAPLAAEDAASAVAQVQRRTRAWLDDLGLSP